MNWNKIKKEYPEAWKVFDNSSYYGFHTRGNGILSKFNQSAQRVLYDFFDDHELTIEVSSTQGMRQSGDNITFNTDVMYKDKNHMHNDHNYSTRSEAETAAFEKAFEMLEKKLSQ